MIHFISILLVVSNFLLTLALHVDSKILKGKRANISQIIILVAHRKNIGGISKS